MIRIGLVGVGTMGRGHLEQYVRIMLEDDSIQLVALCDVDPKRFEVQTGDLNIEGVGKDVIDFSKYNLYNDYDEMLAKEQLDMVDLVVPTYLHAEYAVKALDKGLHVLCEKPMALNPDECQRMIDARDRSGKQLMIAQCLRFWPAYEQLKAVAADGRFGKPVCAYLARYGGSPKGSYQDWYFDEAKSGGCLLDQHIHDVDMVQWVFGMPEAVSTTGRNVNPGAGFDALSTNYRYPDFTVNTQDDWTINGDGFGFDMPIRANFEKGSVVHEKGKLTLYPNGEAPVVPELPPDKGYYREIVYFLDHIKSGEPIETSTPESTRDTIRVATAERISAKQRGEWVKLASVN
ncbi:hypothetical protein FACS18948_2730 [Clostridia bacterium]|nr:hypothetical protein FACS18948_2730 [Clostridia bacterium]